MQQGMEAMNDRFFSSASDNSARNGRNQETRNRVTSGTAEIGIHETGMRIFQ
jgi:hypothetical protein